MKNSPLLSFAFLMCSITLSNAQAPCFTNPSFNGTVGMSVNPTNFTACNNTPDVQPQPGNPLNVPAATNGSTMMGLASPGQTQGEEAGTQLCAALIPGQTYSFNIDLARVNSQMNGMTGNPNLEIWGGLIGCSKDELLYTSAQITSTSFQTYAVCFTANQPFSYIVFRALGNGSGLAYLLLDNIQENLSPQLSLTESHIAPNCNQANGSITVTATGGNVYTYQWLPTGGSSATEANLSEGAYSCIVSSTVGCFELTDTLFVTLQDINTLGTLETSYSVEESACGLSNGSISVNASGTVQNVQYNWIPQVSSSSIAEDLPAGVYLIEVTGTDACNNLLVDTLTVNLTSADSIQGFISQPAAICEGDSVQLVAEPGNAVYTYTWNPNAHIVSSANTAVVFPDQETTYSVIISYQGCISDTVETTLSVYPRPNVIVNNLSICQGEHGILTADGAESYLWSTGATSHSIDVNPMASVNYQVIGTANGCADTAQSQIEFHPVPQAVLIPNHSVLDLSEPSVIFSNLSTNASDYYWTFDDGSFSTSDSTQLSHTFEDVGNYNVCLLAENSYGCADSTCVTIRIKTSSSLYIPNSFTPDGDEFNNYFFAQGTNITEFHMTIYDRWGQIVFETADLSDHWDGRDPDGEELAKTDTYTWTVHVIDTDGNHYEKTGHLTLLK